VTLHLRHAVIALLAAGCGGPSTTPNRPSPAVAPAPVPAAKWTSIPQLGVRVRCEGQVIDFGKWATVTCNHTALTLRYEEDATTIDEALEGHEAEQSVYLQGSTTHAKRSPHRYRTSYENKGGVGMNYWVDVMIELGGRVLTCQTGSFATADTSPEAAAAAGDICETIEPLR